MKNIVPAIFILMMMADNSSAQLCSGNFGDPIVNVDFGSGTNPGPALSTSITSYHYVTDDCPNDGDYAIRTGTQNCFGSTWHSLSSDHTGNGNGYMMVINASFERGVFYNETVRNLCAGTTYQFSAYLLNLLRNSTCPGSAILPDISFIIERTDGTVIGSVDTGPINSSSTAIWKQYGFVFTLPTAVTEAVLKIKNNADGGCGNDIALDDIQFRPCGPSVSANILGHLSDTVSHCSGTAAAYTLMGTSSNFYANPAYRWQIYNGGQWSDINSAHTLQYTLNIAGSVAAGTYRYRLSTAEAENIDAGKCRVSSQELVIKVLESPSVNAGPDKIIIAGDAVQLEGSVSGDSTVYAWDNAAGMSNTAVLHPLVNPVADQFYVLKAMSMAGCGNDSDDVFVKVYKDVFFPNSFTPNGDGLNDNWVIHALDAFPAYELKIYNRYGQLVFSDPGNRKPWNGKFGGQDALPGVYVYFFKPANSKWFKKGTLLLLR